MSVNLKFTREGFFEGVQEIVYNKQLHLLALLAESQQSLCHGMSILSIT